MLKSLELKNSNGKNIQINCVRGGVIAGEDGSIKVDDEYLPYAVDSNGWLIEIDDVCMIDENTIAIVSPSGVISIYRKENNIWTYKILLESDECFYEITKAYVQEIKEPTLVVSLLHLYINTEFRGNKEYTFDITN